MCVYPRPFPSPLRDTAVLIWTCADRRPRQGLAPHERLVYACAEEARHCRLAAHAAARAAARELLSR